METGAALAISPTPSLIMAHGGSGTLFSKGMVDGFIVLARTGRGGWARENERDGGSREWGGTREEEGRGKGV